MPADTPPRHLPSKIHFLTTRQAANPLLFLFSDLLHPFHFQCAKAFFVIYFFFLSPGRLCQIRRRRFIHTMEPYLSVRGATTRQRRAGCVFSSPQLCTTLMLASISGGFKASISGGSSHHRKQAACDFFKSRREHATTSS